MPTFQYIVNISALHGSLGLSHISLERFLKSAFNELGAATLLHFLDPQHQEKVVL